MSKKQIPYGISNYKTLIREGYAYIDKTMYIPSLELAGHYTVFLRPYRFGKTLFTSMLGYYYDISEKDNFDLLFSSTDIGRNPTKKKNAYYVLKFDFSGIKTDSYEIMEDSFTRNIYDALLAFCVRYQLDITPEMNRPSIQLLRFFTDFRIKCNGKIYVIIDDYDIFAHQLLSSEPSAFKDIASRDGFVRTWYGILKEGTETILDRIFITGTSPITLDRVRSDFNISLDLSMRGKLHEMIGFTKTEIETLIQETIPEGLPFALMDTLYNGYCFSEDGKDRVFNSDMVLYYLYYYQQEHTSPNTLLDHNAASDFEKLKKLTLFENQSQNMEVLKKIVDDGYTTSSLREYYYDLDRYFGTGHFKALLFYLGFLTIKERYRSSLIFEIPNAAMTGLYLDFLMETMSTETNYNPDIEQITKAMHELAYENSCEKLVTLIEGLLHSIANQDNIQFDEKYIKIAMAAYAKISKLYIIKPEYEAEKKSVDLILFPRDNASELDILLFELRYITKEDIPGPVSANSCLRTGTDGRLIVAKLYEAMDQLKEYSSAKEFTGKKIACWAIVFVGDKCVERVIRGCH